MSEFEVKVYKIAIEPHPDQEAHSIELARVGDFLSVVRKGMYQDGQLAAYIPEAALCPQAILETLNLVGGLAGPGQNRVKAIRLRKVLSQGLIYPPKPEWIEGQDVTEELGITKWEPKIPESMSGILAGSGTVLKFDIENIKKDRLYKDGDQVVFTEKTHGTCMIVGYHREDQPENTETPYYDGHFQIGTKNSTRDGFFFTPCEKNDSNVYVRAFRGTPGIAEALEFLDAFGKVKDPAGKPFLLGEAYGKGVQDLGYGVPTGEVRFGLFAAVWVGADGTNHWMKWNELKQVSEKCNLGLLPALYEGPFSQEVLAQYTSGKESLSGKSTHMREGVVVQYAAAQEDTHHHFRKSISPEYLLRKGDTTELT